MAFRSVRMAAHLYRRRLALRTSATRAISVTVPAARPPEGIQDHGRGGRGGDHG
jgi:hypothetical protein